MRARAMTTAIAVGLLLGFGALALGAKPAPKPLKLSAALNVGQERPHPKGTKVGASGRFTATLTGTTLAWRLTFGHLSGPATAAHIHMAPKGKPGAIIISLCGPCTSPVSGTTTVTNDQISAMKGRQTYVNVHTAKNPAGEIRGQISVAR